MKTALVVLGIALAIAGFLFVQSFLQVANHDRCSDIQARVEDYREANGHYPPDLSSFSWWARRDMWGRRVFYERRGDGYILVSFGRDGKPDGTDYWELRMRLDESGHYYASSLRNHEYNICGDYDRDEVLSDAGWIQVCGL